MSDEDDLGPCCICGGPTSATSHNIVMLDVKGQVPGHGWGCFGCGLPMDGASAVLCDPCAEAFEEDRTPLRFACRGFPATDGRVPIEQLTEPHAHDMAKHAGDPAIHEGAVCIYAEDGALIMPGRPGVPPRSAPGSAGTAPGPPSGTCARMLARAPGRGDGWGAVSATPLVIGPAELAALDALRERAAARPVDMPRLMEDIQTTPGKARHKAQMTAQSVCLPLDFMVTFSIETGHPVGTCRHMSMSSGKRGRVPSPQALMMVAEALGFVGGLDACCGVWVETLEGHGRAVNLVQPLSMAAAPATAQ